MLSGVIANVVVNLTYIEQDPSLKEDLPLDFEVYQRNSATALQLRTQNSICLLRIAGAS